MERDSTIFSKKMEPLLCSASELELDQFWKAFEIAESELEGVKRSDNSPFINHLIEVSEIIVSHIGLQLPSITAYFLHEASRVDNSILDRESGHFSQDVIEMARGLNNISKIKPKETRLQADNYRRLILSYSRDPRVTLIKLADRLEIMRALEHFSKSKQIKKATETLFLYAPLAHQLDLYGVKSEMEDLSFKYRDPENYRLITNKLKSGEHDRKRISDLFIRPIEQDLKGEHIKYQLKSRTKTAYSIYKKMQKQEITFEDVADLFAIRIIVDAPIEREKEIIWKVYSIVTGNYQADLSRLRDWITVPKKNGYESLHITVLTKEGSRVEVQIRSERMDQIAEQGAAAHTAYKGIKSEEAETQWLSRVKELLESGEIIRGEGDLGTAALDEIFVFTPNGDLRRLGVGATVLDFAFDIHTNLGTTCSGARVNGRGVSIRERLNSGDVVEIISNRNQKPTADWLNYVVSSKAKAKIKQRIRQEELKRAKEGREILERRVNNWKFTFNDELIEFLMKHYKFKVAGELYSKVATGELELMEIKSLLGEKERGEKLKLKEEFEKTLSTEEGVDDRGGGDYLVIDKGVGNVSFKLAKCCNPIMGDAVFGFVTIRDGITIHRFSCPNAARLIERYPYRVQKVKWREGSDLSRFQASLKIVGYGEASAAQQLFEVTDSMSITVRNFSLNEKGGRLEARLVVVVSNNRQLDSLIHNLKRLKGVKSVNRVSNV